MLTAAQRIRLLAAIDEDRLVVLCGAGLSIPFPSKLPSAVRVAEICFDFWKSIDPTIPTALRQDLDKLAAHFVNENLLDRFIGLVPWNLFRGPWNDGHAAVGDLLAVRAAFATLSANYDTMIERWVSFYRGVMDGALTGEQAAATSGAPTQLAPLLKFHGCETNASQTIWTEAQLTDVNVKNRLQSCANWMKLILPNKDLVVVGFWSDWKYLNKLLAEALGTASARSVLVVDPADSAALQAKAPNLWATLNSLSGTFEHVPESGAAVLTELRTEFSRVWLRRFYAFGLPGTTFDPGLGPLDTDVLYDLRRDAEGVDGSALARQRSPNASASAAAALQIELLEKGATRARSWFQYNGKLVRIVNGGGRLLRDAEASFAEAPSLPPPDVVVCAGSEDFGVPARVVGSGSGTSTVRPGPGRGVRWLTSKQGRTELGL